MEAFWDERAKARVGRARTPRKTDSEKAQVPTHLGGAHHIGHAQAEPKYAQGRPNKLERVAHTRSSPACAPPGRTHGCQWVCGRGRQPSPPCSRSAHLQDTHKQSTRRAAGRPSSCAQTPVQGTDESYNYLLRFWHAHLSPPHPTSTPLGQITCTAGSSKLELNVLWPDLHINLLYLSCMGS
jgi:hypothetical protein